MQTEDDARTGPEMMLFEAAAAAGVATLVAGVWVSYGLGRALMLTGATILFGCWKAA